jgi:hypothetical protein
MVIENLPIELQNKIYTYVGIHPVAKIIRDNITKHREHINSYNYDCIDEDEFSNIYSYIYFKCIEEKRTGRVFLITPTTI